MEAGKKELLQVVGIKIPDPGQTHSACTEGVPFGVHYATLKKEKYDWEVVNLCNGDLKLFDEGENTLGPSQKQTEIRCSECEFCLSFYREKWEETIFEWMRLVFGTVVRQIVHYPPGSNLAEKQRLSWTIEQEIKICNPKYWISDFHQKLLNRIHEIAWGKKDIEFFPITWKNYGLVIARVLDLDCDGLKLVLADAGILMTAMEQSFQEAIKRAAQLACSASEPFHPDTRRNR